MGVRRNEVGNMRMSEARWTTLAGQNEEQWQGDFRGHEQEESHRRRNQVPGTTYSVETQPIIVEMPSHIAYQAVFRYIPISHLEIEYHNSGLFTLGLCLADYEEAWRLFVIQYAVRHKIIVAYRSGYIFADDADIIQSPHALSSATTTPEKARRVLRDEDLATVKGEQK